MLFFAQKWAKCMRTPNPYGKNPIELIKHYGTLRSERVDSPYIRRYLRAAIRLLNRVGGDVEHAKLLCEATAQWCEERNLSWTLETVMKVSDRALTESSKGQDSRQSLHDALKDLL